MTEVAISDIRIAQDQVSQTSHELEQGVAKLRSEAALRIRENVRNCLDGFVGQLPERLRVQWKEEYSDPTGKFGGHVTEYLTREGSLEVYRENGFLGFGERRIAHRTLITCAQTPDQWLELGGKVLTEALKVLKSN